MYIANTHDVQYTYLYMNLNRTSCWTQDEQDQNQLAEIYTNVHND